jgi:HEAT repeat protein
MNKNRHLIYLAVLLSTLMVLPSTLAFAADAPNTSPEKEKELLAVLRSDAPSSEKAIACKLLAIHGSNAAVPDLAKLLTDPQLASWSRIALEVIPGKAADEALRKAVGLLKGRLLVGTINSIGVRKDSQAVKLLMNHLKGKDIDVASAAAVALGRIGNSDAANTLRKSLALGSDKVRSAVAEGCILCAEKYLSEGKPVVATEIYNEVRQANVPMQRILEATRGAILAQNDKGIPLLLEQFRSSNKELFEIALSTAREFPGSKVDQALAKEMVSAKPERAALIIQAMADRKETVVLIAILKAAGEGPKKVRLAAITALGRVGDVSCLSDLLDIAIESDSDISQTAKATLAILTGKKVDTQIVELLPKTEGKMYPLLIELVGMRRINAIPNLLKALNHSDKVVRSAALTSLGETVTPKELHVLISQVITPKHTEDVPVAQKALKAASIRMPDREVCAAELTEAFGQSSSVPTKSSLLKIMGAVGGTKALATIGLAAKSNDSQLQDVSSRLLGVWMTIDAAPVLLDLAKTAPSEKYKVRALRGYIRITRQFIIPIQKRAEMCQKAFEASQRTAEKNLVLDVLKRYPSLKTLKLAISALQDPELNEKATQTTLVIAEKLDSKSDKVRELLSKAGFSKVKLEIIHAEYGSGTKLENVTEVLQKLAGDSRLIKLSSSSYNANFGGDPSPGATKQLKIKYRLNDKVGEVSFDENELIILPMPK